MCSPAETAQAKYRLPASGDFENLDRNLKLDMTLPPCCSIIKETLCYLKAFSLISWIALVRQFSVQVKVHLKIKVNISVYKEISTYYTISSSIIHQVLVQYTLGVKV